MEANSAVIVVPIFSPKIIAAATSKGSHPFAHIVNVMAIAALEDCTTIVIIVPTSTKNNRENIPYSVKDFNQFKALLCQQENGGDPIIPFDEIINTTKASFAAIESLKEGKWISIK